MKSPNNLSFGPRMLAEMKEFGSFPKGAQRYIRRSLDLGLNRLDAISRWSRDPGEESAIRAQLHLYAMYVPRVRESVPKHDDIRLLEPFFAALLPLTAFDIGQNRLTAFCEYRFLYERLFGAKIRSWLPAAFCGASALPALAPNQRRCLLQSISEAAATAAGWSSADPIFFPEWVEKVEPAPPSTTN